MAGDSVTPALLSAIRDLFGSGFVYVRGFVPGPIVGSGRGAGGHYGIDLAAKTGTPIRAATGGIVMYAGYAGDTISGRGAQAKTPGYFFGGGNVVGIAIPYLNGASIVQTYAHMQSFAPSVAPGTQVNKGDIIGYVGATGNTTGPHLHFGAYDLSARKFVSPIPYLLLAQQNVGGSLSFWNNWITFANGHVLTTTDVDAIIKTLDQHKAFQAVNAPPILGQLAENQARDTTRAILMTHIGQKWTPELASQLQTQFFGASKAAATNPLTDLVSLLGRLFDPGTWIRILALILGAILFLYGGANVLRATA